VLYDVDDSSAVVEVLRVERRDEVYRGI